MTLHLRVFLQCKLDLMGKKKKKGHKVVCVGKRGLDLEGVGRDVVNMIKTHCTQRMHFFEMRDEKDNTKMVGNIRTTRELRREQGE